MSRTSTLILFGVLVILTPFSGLPVSFRTLLAVMLGAGVAIIGLLIRSEEAKLQKSSDTPVVTPSSDQPSESIANPIEMSAM